jgi:hypothetical protein
MSLPNSVLNRHVSSRKENWAMTFVRIAKMDSTIIVQLIVVLKITQNHSVKIGVFLVKKILTLLSQSTPKQLINAFHVKQEHIKNTLAKVRVFCVIEVGIVQAQQKFPMEHLVLLVLKVLTTN